MAPSGVIPGRARRRLRRNTSSALLPVETQPQMCIRGSVRKHWMVLPVQQVGGKTCCTLSTRTRWLYQMLCGHNGPKVYRQAVGNFVEECMRAFRATRTEQTGAAGLEPSGHGIASSGTAGHAQPGLERKGRAAILDDSDEEDLELMAKPSGLPAKKRRTKQGSGKPRRGEWVTVTIRGFALQLTVVRGPRLAIPCEGPWLQRIIQDLHPRANEASSQVEKDAMGWGDEDRGRISWRGESSTNQASWVVWYSDATGKRREFRAGLGVKRVGVTGEPLTADGFSAAARQVLATARVHWNRLDCSGAPRYCTGGSVAGSSVA